jgi:amidohydrolase
MKKEILQAELEKQFKWFHAHPELSYEEYETTKRIRQLLEDESIEILDLPLETGLVAIIRGKKSGPVIALRGDIDALSIQEETSLEWKSKEAGKMHACGHDFHLTAVYGAAVLLKELEEKLCGTVKLIFQPAEESSLGALKIIETGVLEDVSAIFGIHSAANFPVGTLGIKEGSVTAAVDRFQIRLKGFGTHGASPHTGKDPIVATAALINALQTIVSRNINPFSAGLLSITHVTAGNTWNVIPEKAFIEGTVRTTDKDDRLFFEKRLKEITKSICKAYEVEGEVNWIVGPPATNNDQKWTEFAKKVANEAGITVERSQPSLGGEDFAFYQEFIKGVFIQIGTGETYPNHHPKFQVNPAALSVGAEYLCKLSQKALQH